MSQMGVRRDKAALSSGRKSHPAIWSGPRSRNLSNRCQNAIEHRSGLAGIDGFKALRERAVDLGEFIVGFRSSSVLRQKPRKPCTASLKKCAGMLGLRGLHGAPEAAFRFRLVARLLPGPRRE
jgi:hypothetical protein